MPTWLKSLRADLNEVTWWHVIVGAVIASGVGFIIGRDVSGVGVPAFVYTTLGGGAGVVFAIFTGLYLAHAKDVRDARKAAQALLNEMVTMKVAVDGLRKPLTGMPSDDMKIDFFRRNARRLQTRLPLPVALTDDIDYALRAS